MKFITHLFVFMAVWVCGALAVEWINPVSTGITMLLGYIVGSASRWSAEKCEAKVGHKPEPRCLKVEGEHYRKLLELTSEYCDRPKGKDHVASHNLWCYINDNFPETKTGNWAFNLNSGDRSAEIIEKI